MKISLLFGWPVVTALGHLLTPGYDHRNFGREGLVYQTIFSFFLWTCPAFVQEMDRVTEESVLLQLLLLKGGCCLRRLPLIVNPLISLSYLAPLWSRVGRGDQGTSSCVKTTDGRRHFRIGQGCIAAWRFGPVHVRTEGALFDFAFLWL